MVAFCGALREGADSIELDVHLSHDGVPVVIHDSTLDRTCNGTGPVKERTVSELQRYDAGSWFDGAYARERIPTLEEVLAWAKGRAVLHIEIKAYPIRYRGRGKGD